MELDLVTIFLDANVLFPPKIRDLFTELGRERACIVRWSEDVQQEWINIGRVVGLIRKYA